MHSPHLVIITDLDGTLLDHHTYTWDAALPALRECGRRKVPVVFCTSKTRAEVEVLRRVMGNAHPFITENGGGVFIPHGYFSHRIENAATVKTFHCIALARPYSEITQALEEIAHESGAEVVGFHQMRAKEIAENSGLRLKDAELARLRDFDEPFFFAGTTPEAEQKFLALARERKLEVTRGSRFWHLHGGSDKGRAVRELLKHYRTGRHAKVRSAGFGDAANDLPMLAAVDQPFLVQRPNGSYDDAVTARLLRIQRADAPGPQGWNDAVLRMLRP
jgi:mannosyl-3-phosphoglycerate phosphatase